MITGQRNTYITCTTRWDGAIRISLSRASHRRGYVMRICHDEASSSSVLLLLVHVTVIVPQVMTSSEARDLMAQNSHDVTILDGEQADAINLANIRNNSDVIIGDNDNQIMVLESGQKSGSMSMDGIEILEDKDIRILEGKGLDDRFVDGITFLSQTKIDDLLLGPKSLAIDGDGGLTGHDDGKCHFVVIIYIIQPDSSTRAFL